MALASNQRGAAAVEMAFLLLPLIFIVFGISEFGRAIYQYNTIAKATRDAARYLSTQQPDATSTANAECLAVYGNFSCTSPPLAPNLTTSQVAICDWTTCPGTHLAQGTAPVVNLVTVTVTGYPFDSLVPFVTANLATITFGDIRTTMKSNI
jgi:Flp pilus assembly protein TadG